MKREAKPRANVAECMSLIVRAAAAMGYNANQTHEAISLISDRRTFYRRWRKLAAHPLCLAPAADEGDDDA